MYPVQLTCCAKMRNFADVKKSKLIAVLIFVFSYMAGSAAYAQIVDDSTRQIYGPRTTLNLFERDVLQGRYIEQRIDTAIQNLNNERFWYQDTSFYQHLGNIGTASKPILFSMPQRIGVRLGRNAFDRYAYDPQNINYFDTRSPYSHLFYVQGQRGEQVFEATYARNITERWNAGLAYQIISSSRQIGTPDRGTRGGNFANSSAFKFFTHYRSTNDKYDLFANFTLQKVSQLETGGVRPEELEPGVYEVADSLFGYETEILNLNNALTQERRNNLHLLHIYKILGEDLKAYHGLDWGRQQNTFRDLNLVGEELLNGTLHFYPDTLYSGVRTDDRTNYRELQNELGFTGNSKFSFFKAYLKHRRSSIENRALQTFSRAVGDTSLVTENTAFNQLFVGGQFRLNYKEKAVLMVDGELQLVRDYRLKALARITNVELSHHRVLRSASLTEERVLSNHYEWNKDFTTVLYDQSMFAYGSRIGRRQFVRFSSHFTNILRYIYFNKVDQHNPLDTRMEPVQYDGNQTFYGARLEHHIRFGSIHFENFVAYTNTDEAEVIRIPEWLFNSKLYFQGGLFNSALFGQFGVEMHMPTAYNADAYNPVIQQFYPQDFFQVQTYPVLDVFVTGDIKNVNFFLKMSHVNQGLMPQPGYFATPYYPGMRRSFIFGLKWMFFD